MTAFVADQLAGIAVGLGIAVALALVLCVVRAVLDLIDDWHITDPDRHKTATKRVELIDS